MRACVFTLLFGVVMAVAVPEAHAQRVVYRNLRVTPTPVPGNYSYSTYYGNPNGAQAAVTTGVYPTPYGGYNSYYSTTTAVNPVYMGPYVSVIWDPFTMTYRYTSGYTNTPNYGYFSGYTIPNAGFYSPY